jgi:hypothetical protein
MNNAVLFVHMDSYGKRRARENATVKQGTACCISSNVHGLPVIGEHFKTKRLHQTEAGADCQ